MRFRKLRLAGFKSFVEPAELLIEPGLTGVVGPNGCGKSNLLEAIRWVMGEGSPKSLRGGGMEDVIFAGTASRPPRDFAEVALLVEDGEGEREVARRIERGAGSAYRLNGRDVRQRDVALLFADAATGAHSPALVSQGRIAAVIAAKPAERRQMLEEAAGIAGLHVRRREAEQRLRATEANLQRLDEMLGEMATRAGALRRQARAAERYRLLSAEIRLAEARALFARWRAAAAGAEQAHARAAQAEAVVTEAAEAQRAAAAHAQMMVLRAAETRAAAERARDAQGEARHAAEALRAEHTTAIRRLAELAQQIEAIARDRAREDQLALDAAEALRALEVEDKTLAKILAAGEPERIALDAAVTETERAVRDAEVAMAQALARSAAEEADARVAAAALAAASQRLARARDEVDRHARDLAALGEADPLAHAVEQARLDSERADAAIHAAAAALADAEAARDAAAATRDATQERAGLATAALARDEAEAKALATTLHRDDSGGARLLSRLTVASGYERALAAALGDDLDAPVGGEGARAWAGAAARPDDPSLPAGAQPLAERVYGGEVIARRLAQVGVAERDEGQPLAVGQRLVTRSGLLRRWDGFVALDLGATAAERLVRANRLAELQTALPALRSAAEEAGRNLENARGAQAASRQAVEGARRQLAAADESARTTRRQEDAAIAARDRRVTAVAALQSRTERAAVELAAALRAEEDAQVIVAALPDRSASRVAGERLSTEARLARERLASARAAAATMADHLARDARRQQAARAEAKGWRARAGDAAGRLAEMERRNAAAESERAGLADRPQALQTALDDAQQAVAKAAEAVRSTREAETAAENELRRQEALAATAGEALAAAREARATATATAQHQEERRGDLSRLSGERFGCPAATLAAQAGFDVADLRSAEEEQGRHDRLTAERERLGPVNLVAEQELTEIEEARAANAAEREELGQAVHRLRGSIGSLNREGRQRLTAAFEAVDGHFRRLFTTLFAGGEAHLALIDSDDPLEAGLEIMAQPPGKRLGSLTLLSGGEQALTAIALIFALFLTNPAPICVLDEVDAPLDDANIERFCDLLMAMTGETDTRYLVVTHNAVTMSRMHRLFGVTMIERGVSRLVSVDLGGAETLLAAE